MRVAHRTPPVIERPDVLDSLRAMGLTSIGDIGQGGLTTDTTETITWGTASDWDNAVNEDSVTHEIYGDYAADDTIFLGYPTFDRGGTALEAFYPQHEDSGTTLVDASGNNRDGSINGGTVDVTGMLGGSAISYDGTDDYSHVPQSVLDPLAAADAFTFFTWFLPDSIDDSNSRVISDPNVNEYGFFIKDHDANSGDWQFGVISGGNLSVMDPSSQPFTGGAWNSLAGTFSGADTYMGFFANGSLDAEDTSAPGSMDNGTNGLDLGGPSNKSEWYGGDMCFTRIYSRRLSSSEISTLHDVTAGRLTTSTKSFSTAVGPDLQNLQYNLNNETITLDVIGSPGTVDEEVVTQTLDGATSYSLSWANTHVDFRVRVEPSTATNTRTPDLSQVELVA